MGTEQQRAFSGCKLKTGLKSEGFKRARGFQQIQLVLFWDLRLAQILPKYG